MSLKSQLVQLSKPYYWINLLLCCSYVASRMAITGELDGRETEILMFLAVVVALRTKRAGSLSLPHYLSSAFLYGKAANLALWFYSDLRFGLIYGALFVLCGLVLPEPTYTGPENVTYFRGLQLLDEEMARSKGTIWVLCLYAAWHPACVNFASVFSEMSSKYHLANLKFGKLDVGRYPEAAKKYRVFDGPTTRQLPTVILFKNGTEDMRRPAADHSGKLMKFFFSLDNVRAAFELDELYKECKQRLGDVIADKKTD